jgi:hypothetical protein
MRMQEVSAYYGVLFLVTTLGVVSETVGQERRDQSHEFENSVPHVKSLTSSLLNASPSGDSTAWAKVQWVGGRLHLDAPRHKQGSQSLCCKDITERLTVSACRGLPKVHYVCKTRDWQWMLSFDNPHSMTIESLDRVSGNRAIATQNDHDPILIEYQSEGQTTRIESISWIHLHHSDRQLIEKHFVPLMDCLVPHQPLASIANQTDQAMAFILPDLVPVGIEVESLVARLKHPSRMKRREAERDLLMMGTPLLAMLDGLDSSRWNSHQQAIIADIENRLSQESSDTASSLGYRFINDPQYWIAWINNADRQPTLQPALASHLLRLGIAAQPYDRQAARVCLQSECKRR